MTKIKRLLPYLILTVLTILWWRFSTLTSNYAWSPKGKELLMLDISLTKIFFYKAILWLTIGNIVMFSIISFYKKEKGISIIAVALALLIRLVGGQWINKELAFSYYVVFKNQSVTEEYIERPILESGYQIGPKLTEYIQDTSSKYRRYAISGLGKIKYGPGAATLKQILFSDNEPEFIREDALIALKTLGTEEAEKIIKEYEGQRKK